MTGPSRVARGKNVYGSHVGVVMVDTDLPRPLGDIGHAGSLGFPVSYAVAHGARPQDMVATGRADGVEAFIESAKGLVTMGVDSITTSCGLMARHQRRLTEELDVPVASSSLLTASLVLRVLPSTARLGILTIDSGALRDGGHFDGVGLTDDERARISIAGMEGADHFHSAIMDDEAELDLARATEEVVAAAARLLRDDPAVGALLLECTNLSPYAPALRRATRLPVWDAIALVHWLHEGVAGGSAHFGGCLDG